MVNYRHCGAQQVFRTYSIYFMEDLHFLNSSFPWPTPHTWATRNHCSILWMLLWCIQRYIWKYVLVFTYTEDTKGWKIHCPFLVSTTNGDLPLALDVYLHKNEVTCCCSCWLSIHPERGSGWGAEMRHSVLGKKKPAEQSFQIVKYSQEPILWAQFLYLSLFFLEKH